MNTTCACHSLMTEQKECEKVAKYLGKNFTARDNTHYPYGCVIYRHIFFNRNKEGKQNENIRPICKGIYLHTILFFLKIFEELILYRKMPYYRYSDTTFLVNFMVINIPIFYQFA